MIYKFKEFKDEPLLINHLNMGGKIRKVKKLTLQADISHETENLG